jgi:hypothetical protein
MRPWSTTGCCTMKGEKHFGLCKCSGYHFYANLNTRQSVITANHILNLSSTTNLRANVITQKSTAALFLDVQHIRILKFHTTDSLDRTLRQRIHTELRRGKFSEGPVWNTVKHMLARSMWVTIFYEAERKDLIEKRVQFRNPETVLNTRNTYTEFDLAPSGLQHFSRKLALYLKHKK